MIDLSTKYLGLNLKNPIIVGSCGLTNSLEDIKELQLRGAAAVVLKSIFEEEILMEYSHELKKVSTDESNLEYYDYLDYKIKEDNINKYINLIKSCKQELTIPVIASINCKSTSEWIFFAKKIKEAGADAIEINAFIMPSDTEQSAENIENIYFNIIQSIKKEVKIPIALKLSYYFTNLASMIKRLSKTGVNGLVLFNRFFSPDFDISGEKIISSHVLSTPEEIAMPLRWIGMMSGKVSCDLSASTGVHDGYAAVKQILAGATVVQVVSTLYRNGTQRISQILEELTEWMKENNYSSVSDFRGRMAQDKNINPSIYERVQFMKYFSDMKK